MELLALLNRQMRGTCLDAQARKQARLSPAAQPPLHGKTLRN